MPKTQYFLPKKNNQKHYIVFKWLTLALQKGVLNPTSDKNDSEPPQHPSCLFKLENISVLRGLKIKIKNQFWILFAILLDMFKKSMVWFIYQDYFMDILTISITFMWHTQRWVTVF